MYGKLLSIDDTVPDRHTIPEFTQAELTMLWKSCRVVSSLARELLRMYPDKVSKVYGAATMGSIMNVERLSEVLKRMSS